MPSCSISWGNDLAWDSRADRQQTCPGGRFYRHGFMDMSCWKCLPSLLSRIYLRFLNNLGAGKALGVVLALSFLLSLKLQLQAELATWLIFAVRDWEQFPLGPDPHAIIITLPHPGASPGCCSHCSCCRSHSLSYEVVLHLHPFATMAQLAFLRRPFRKISLPASQIRGIFSRKKGLCFSLTSSDIC